MVYAGKLAGSLKKMGEGSRDAVENVVRWAVQEAARRGWVEDRPGLAEALTDFVRLLAKWNRVYNLTALEDPTEVAELHLLDSLAVAPWVPAGARVLDVGAGAGFPGFPLAMARPDVQVVLVDRTEKKVAFMKNAIARSSLRNARPLHLRLEGKGKEDLGGPFDVVVSRAFAAPEVWLPFGAAYARRGGKVIGMLGGRAPEMQEIGRAVGISERALERVDYVLPSGARRGILVWVLEEEAAS